MASSRIEDRWVIQSPNGLVGIVVHDRAGWVFFAAESSIWDLNGKIFGTVQDAEKAVRNSLRGRSISTAAKPNAL